MSQYATPDHDKDFTKELMQGTSRASGQHRFSTSIQTVNQHPTGGINV